MVAACGEVWLLGFPRFLTTEWVSIALWVEGQRALDSTQGMHSSNKLTCFKLLGSAANNFSG